MGDNEALSAAGRHRAVLLDAAAGLEFAIASPVGRGVAWRELVDGELHRLRGALADHTTAVESDDGLLADIVHQAPRLSNLVKLLRRDHVEMDARIVGRTDGPFRSYYFEDPAFLREMAEIPGSFEVRDGKHHERLVVLEATLPERAGR